MTGMEKIALQSQITYHLATVENARKDNDSHRSSSLGCN